MKHLHVMSDRSTAFFQQTGNPGEAPGKSGGTQGWGTGRGECLSFLSFFFLCPDVTGVFYLTHGAKRSRKQT